MFQESTGWWWQHEMAQALCLSLSSRITAMPASVRRLNLFAGFRHTHPDDTGGGVTAGYLQWLTASSNKGYSYGSQTPSRAWGFGGFQESLWSTSLCSLFIFSDSSHLESSLEKLLLLFPLERSQMNTHHTGVEWSLFWWCACWIIHTEASPARELLKKGSDLGWNTQQQPRGHLGSQHFAFLYWSGVLITPPCAFHTL